MMIDLKDRSNLGARRFDLNLIGEKVLSYNEVVKNELFQEFILGKGGSFYNVSLKGFFGKLFTQCCHVSVNIKSVGLVVVELFLYLAILLSSFG